MQVYEFITFSTLKNSHPILSLGKLEVVKTQNYQTSDVQNCQQGNNNDPEYNVLA